MNKKLAKNFAFYSAIDCSIVPTHQLEETSVMQESDLKPVLDEIFSVDPDTGLPKGDIQYFLSKSGNPQVKAFIETALFAPRSQNGMVDPAKISDDLIVELSRNPDETYYEYADRLAKFRDDAIAEYEKVSGNLISD